MDEMEFLTAVQRVYSEALAAGKSQREAHRLAEMFRSNLIVTLAQQAMARRGEPRNS